MKYDIQGDNMPVVICSLDDGESMICEAGAMSWMTPNMEMETKSGGAVYPKKENRPKYPDLIYTHLHPRRT